MNRKQWIFTSIASISMVCLIDVFNTLSWQYIIGYTWACIVLVINNTVLGDKS